MSARQQTPVCSECVNMVSGWRRHKGGAVLLCSDGLEYRTAPPYRPTTLQNPHRRHSHPDMPTCVVDAAGVVAVKLVGEIL